jgi:predicted DNA-binding transcriptional regulator YafY
MLETSARLLKLLSLLQVRTDWTGTMLADELGVTGRTVRRDVERLRELGYAVHTTRGSAGGYRLGSGRALPPLLFDEDEALAAALGLQLGGVSWASGLAKPATSALHKLRQVLPARLHGQLDSIRDCTEPSTRFEPSVSVELLRTVATVCRRQERLRFDYRTHSGRQLRREVEPYKLVSLDGRWYLLGWDLGRQDWRTYRLDRLEPKIPTGPRFTPRELPTSAAELVSRGVTAAMVRVEGTVRMHASAARLAERAGRYWHTVTPETEDTCILRCSGDSLRTLAWWLVTFDLDFDVVGPSELREHCRLLSQRLATAAGPAAADSEAAEPVPPGADVPTSGRPPRRGLRPAPG